MEDPEVTTPAEPCQAAGEEPSGDAAAEIASPERDGAAAEPEAAPAPAEIVAAPGEHDGAAIEPDAAAAPIVAGDAAAERDDAELKAVIEAIVYVTEEPVTPAQLAVAIGQPEGRIRAILDQLAADYDAPAHGILIREVAGGYQMATKPEHHDAIRAFAKSLKPPLKLSLAALETLATIAYKQPVTAPEIMAIRGVQGAGVLKTLLDRKLITAAGRKNVVGRPILYRTTKEFLVQFGLKDLTELPTLKEFEELRRLAVDDTGLESAAAPEAGAELQPMEPATAPPESPAEPDVPIAAEPPAQPDPPTEPENG